jgi:hypothetical protein
MEDIGIGRIIMDLDRKRDAIHVAVAPVKAASTIRQGSHIGVNADGVADPDGQKIGIVDPFLKQPVKAGETFWLFLYPGTIASLRHAWTHPALPEDHVPQDKVAMAISESRSWLEEFASGHGVRYVHLLDAANSIATGGETGDYLPGLYDGIEIPPELWEHFQNVTGRTVAANRRGDWFSCSC